MTSIIHTPLLFTKLCCLWIHLFIKCYTLSETLLHMTFDPCFKYQLNKGIKCSCVLKSLSDEQPQKTKSSVSTEPQRFSVPYHICQIPPTTCWGNYLKGSVSHSVWTCWHNRKLVAASLVKGTGWVTDAWGNREDSVPPAEELLVFLHPWSVYRLVFSIVDVSEPTMLCQLWQILLILKM